MSNLENHALIEFRAAGWIDENGKFKDEMQEAICKHVLKLLKLFSKEGHSGSSAPYAINLFSTLAKFEPIVPLTGEDWEWNDVSEYGGREGDPLYQNKRCSRVFKDSKGAYDIDGIVWYDWSIDEKTGERYKSYFTNRDSRVLVTFPYTPKTEYKRAIRK
jgi:hypothetical protein